MITKLAIAKLWVVVNATILTENTTTNTANIVIYDLVNSHAHVPRTIAYTSIYHVIKSGAYRIIFAINASEWICRPII